MAEVVLLFSGERLDGAGFWLQPPASLCAGTLGTFLYFFSLGVLSALISRHLSSPGFSSGYHVCLYYFYAGCSLMRGLL